MLVRCCFVSFAWESLIYPAYSTSLSVECSQPKTSDVSRHETIFSPAHIQYNHVFISFIFSLSEVWQFHFVSLFIVSGEPHRGNCGRAIGNPPQYCFCTKKTFWGGGLLSWRGANKTWDEGGKRGCMFIKNWFKLLFFFSPIHQNGHLKIIIYYCRDRYNFVSMCPSKLSSTEWMFSPNYLMNSFRCLCIPK